MAPASKRSSYAEGMELDTESGPQNSITVAAGISAPPQAPEAPPPASSSVGSETDSVQSNPEVMAHSDGIPVGSSREVRDAREISNVAHMMPPIPARSAGRDYYHDYEFSDLDEITMRQLNEDILAYRYDLDYCKAQLEEADLTPQETRTLQLRTLDLGHQIRHCTHRIEAIKAQSRKHGFRPQYGTAAAMPYPANGTNGSGRQHQTGSGGHGVGLLPGGKRIVATPLVAAGKRPILDEDQGISKRAKMASPDMDVAGGGLDEGINTALQRLGFWKCRLCSAPKYLLAGAGRSPAAPCKWPLKDISKMITHFTEMHGEHTTIERCVELGAALAQNRGPFEYWLRRTRGQNISDGGVIDDCFATLLEGEMPDLLRRHSRAAAGMPVH
ncbi:hypothetical protein C8A00DRAFT_14533 [Chaetomidium leptoderma]|uniref:Uncharacterized protein n=1 Tax=Chaetomidium leptoderma TaxID=669021 RepID=A0AAN6VP46_9PEZI|nr:hypothetical protein C8A00DRAFT_14533 [Chaetomidium leptoderma]